MLAVGAGLFVAGVGLAVWASVAEDGAPGWRNAAATCTLAASLVCLLAGGVAR